MTTGDRINTRRRKGCFSNQIVVSSFLIASYLSCLTFTDSTLIPVVRADSDFFDCNCWYGKPGRVDRALQKCECVCPVPEAAGEEPYIQPRCAFKESDAPKLAMALNISDVSEFFATKIEAEVTTALGLSVGDISYQRIDDTPRYFTNYFKPNIVALFGTSSSAKAVEVFNAAKNQTTYLSAFLPSGVLEVEFFNQDLALREDLVGPKLLTISIVDLHLWDVWFLICIMFIIIPCFCCVEGCCCFTADEKTCEVKQELELEERHRKTLELQGQHFGAGFGIAIRPPKPPTPDNRLLQPRGSFTRRGSVNPSGGSSKKKAAGSESGSPSKVVAAEEHGATSIWVDIDEDEQALEGVLSSSHNPLSPTEKPIGSSSSRSNTTDS